MRRRKSPVSPSIDEATHDLHPVEGEPGAQQSDEQDGEEDGEQRYNGEELEDIAGKYEELKTKVEQYFDDANYGGQNKIPVVQG